MSPVDPQKTFWDGVVPLIVHSPSLLLLLGTARLSGEVWLFLYFTYLTERPKNTKYINNSYAKTAIGLIWTSPIFIAVYCLRFRSVEFEFDRSTEIILTSVVFSGMLQLCVTLVTIFAMRRQ